MLKACFECLGGSLRNDSRQNTQNGGETIAISESNNQTFQAPPWPAARRNMYLVPKPLKIEDSIEIKGLMAQSYQTLMVRFLGADSNLEPDEQNVLLQVDFSLNEIGNLNGIEPNFEIIVTENNEFEFLITLLYSRIVFKNSMQMATDQQVEWEPEEIRFISIGGDVHQLTELNFKFAKI